MIYYGCSDTELEQEVRRRHFTPTGSPDLLCEGLRHLDVTQGSDATTVSTNVLVGPHNPVDAVAVFRRRPDDKLEMVRELRPRRAFGKTVDARLLIGEKINHWTMNTFFPTLQLFFDSGLSCTIDGEMISSDAVVGLDNSLRFRLTDINYEEDGQLFKTILPEKFVGPNPSIQIIDAHIARRKSIAVKQLPFKLPHKGPPVFVKPYASMVQEEHVVVGLRLQGMKEMGYIWARVPVPHCGIKMGDRMWGDVRVAGLRDLDDDDGAPVPFLGFPQEVTDPGGQTEVVEKQSMILD